MAKRGPRLTDTSSYGMPSFVFQSPTFSNTAIIVTEESNSNTQLVRKSSIPLVLLLCCRSEDFFFAPKTFLEISDQGGSWTALTTIGALNYTNAAYIPVMVYGGGIALITT